MPKVSIIIPIYNTEKYLERCIDSVVNQTLKDIEIILVNDGSADKSEEICKKYVETDSRIKYIYQPNSGVVAARKNGVKNATAEYVGFVDSDDWVENTLFEQLYTNISDCDIVTSGYLVMKNTSYSVFDDMLPGKYDTKEKMKCIIETMMYDHKKQSTNVINPHIFSKLFKYDIAKEVFNEVEPNVYFSEDAEFVYRCILKSSSVNITNICGYYYFWRENSCVNTVHKTYLKNINDFYNSLYNAFIENEYADLLIEQLQHYVINQITAAPMIMHFKSDCIFLKYISPFLNKLSGKRIALYGAGVVGQNYYSQMQKTKDGVPVIWVDKEYFHYRDRFPVNPISKLKDIDFDYIVIAIERETVAYAVKKSLIEMGFDENSILWEKPYRIY